MHVPLILNPVPVAVITVMYLPTPQLEQITEPSKPLVCLPCGHILHSAVFILLAYFEAGQLVQVNAPKSLENLPGVHSRHETVAFSCWCLPLPQWVHCEDFSLGVYLPWLHSLHVACPTSEVYVPGEQGKHELDRSAFCEKPTGQDVGRLVPLSFFLL